MGNLKMKMRQEIIKFAHELERQDNEAFMLWTWLPSYRAAKKHHGDYSDNFTPPISDILTEATMYIAELKDPEHYKNFPSPEHARFFEQCPCGEDH